MSIVRIGRDGCEVKPRDCQSIVSKQCQDVSRRTRRVRLRPFNREPEVNDGGNELKRIDVKTVILGVARFTSLVNGLHAKTQMQQVRVDHAPQPRDGQMEPASDAAV
jgi:hypothetical protein